MRVAAVGERRDHPIVEGQERHVRALGGSRGVPGAGERADTANRAAAEQAHDVDLVRTLTEHHSAAACRDELLGAARTV